MAEHKPDLGPEACTMAVSDTPLSARARELLELKANEEFKDRMHRGLIDPVEFRHEYQGHFDPHEIDGRALLRCLRRTRAYAHDPMVRLFVQMLSPGHESPENLLAQLIDAMYERDREARQRMERLYGAMPYSSIAREVKDLQEAIRAQQKAPIVPAQPKPSYDVYDEVVNISTETWERIKKVKLLPLATVISTDKEPVPRTPSTNDLAGYGLPVEHITRTLTVGTEEADTPIEVKAR